MKATPLTRLHTRMRQDPCDLEPTGQTTPWSFGPELLLVMVALLSVGMALGVVSPMTGAYLLAASTGGLLLSMAMDCSTA